MKIQRGPVWRCRQSQSINRVHPYRSGNPAIKAVKPYNLNAAEKMHPNIIDLARGPVQANYARQKSELVGARYRRSRVIGHEMLLSRSPGWTWSQSVHMELPVWTPGSPPSPMLDCSILEPSSSSSCPCQSSLLFFSRHCCYPSRRAETTRDHQGWMAEARSKRSFSRKTKTTFPLRVKEGHGAGERQRTESGLGNVEIDVSHCDFKNILKKMNQINENFIFVLSFQLIFLKIFKLSLFHAEILCHTDLIKNWQ